VLYSGNLIRETLKPHQGGFQNRDMHGVETFFQMHRLWLAEYGPKPQVPFPWDQPIAKSSNEATPLAAPGVWLWQFKSAALDANFFDGDFETLKARWLS
jgi:hypothetical protein